MSDEKYFTWHEGKGGQLSKNFHAREFECSCGCPYQKISKELVAKLQALRTNVGIPVTITDAFRCEQRQADLRAAGFETAKGVSQHELGNAADITFPDIDYWMPEIRKLFKAVGVGSGWAHVDLRQDKERLWGYRATRDVVVPSGTS